MKDLLFFAALIATATADLICQCSAPTSGPACEKNTCTVKVGQCYSVQREISIDKEKPVNATSRGCQEDKGDPNVCNEGVVLISSENDFYLLSSVKCCKDKDLCNQDVIPQVPSISEVNKTLSSKKLVCPSCFALGNKTCDIQQMHCKKDQDKCFTLNGTFTKGTAEAQPQELTAKGCAAPSTILKNNINLSFGSVSFKLENVQVEEAKSGANQISNCLSFAIFLPCVLWFLLGISLY